MLPWKKQPWQIVGKVRSNKTSVLFFGLANLLWWLFRTGTKPSRIIYPCQRAAVNNFSVSLSALVPFSITGVLTGVLVQTRKVISRNKNALLAVALIAVIGGSLAWSQSSDNSAEFQLVLESKTATLSPVSDIFVVNGRDAAHIDELINLMGSHGLSFYQSSLVGSNQGPEGLIAPDDVVLLKINSQWDQRGGTNTDVLKELIQAIVDHPDGFMGEIVIADNGQGFGSMNWENNNAEDHAQSAQDVADFFSSAYNVSVYDWQRIRSTRTEDDFLGYATDGYLLDETPDPETGIIVSYPRFRTAFGTEINFRRGVWNGTAYENCLKVINMPILKSHLIYGVTASLKNYMGVQSEPLANGHETVATGGMGTLMIETGLPTLNIIDAIWVNANPYPVSSAGPSTAYNQATRVNVLVAGVDPVALDYWAAKNILMQTASLLGYEDTHTLDPNNRVRSGLSEAFGVWLNLTRNEIARGGYNVTTEEARMNIHVFQSTTSPTSSATLTNDVDPTSPTDLSSSTIPSSSTNGTAGFWIATVILGLAAAVFLYFRKHKERKAK